MHGSYFFVTAWYEKNADGTKGRSMEFRQGEKNVHEVEELDESFDESHRFEVEACFLAVVHDGNPSEIYEDDSLWLEFHEDA